MTTVKLPGRPGVGNQLCFGGQFGDPSHGPPDDDYIIDLARKWKEKVTAESFGEGDSASWTVGEPRRVHYNAQVKWIEGCEGPRQTPVFPDGWECGDLISTNFNNCPGGYAGSLQVGCLEYSASMENYHSTYASAMHCWSMECIEHYLKASITFLFLVSSLSCMHRHI
ncbi:hypothetical protein BDW74DRAFT_160597 [Aspergillus multicolor]|uniref:uncharacterized protein n=1 Tax=Aspergillus multicolor TaxID=41759 RepID=UPI003CCD5114